MPDEPKNQDIVKQLAELKAAGDTMLKTYDEFAKTGYSDDKKRQLFQVAEEKFVSSITSSCLKAPDLQTRKEILQIALDTENKLTDRVNVVRAERDKQNKYLWNSLTGSIVNLTQLTADGLEKIQDLQNKTFPLYKPLTLEALEKPSQSPTEIKKTSQPPQNLNK